MTTTEQAKQIFEACLKSATKIKEQNLKTSASLLVDRECTHIINMCNIGLD